MGYFLIRVNPTSAWYVYDRSLIILYRDDTRQCTIVLSDFTRGFYNNRRCVCIYVCVCVCINYAMKRTRCHPVLLHYIREKRQVFPPRGITWRIVYYLVLVVLIYNIVNTIHCTAASHSITKFSSLRPARINIKCRGGNIAKTRKLLTANKKKCT